MKKDIAMKWVKALRSGKYKQGKTYLNKNDSFCCLGVLCEISEITTKTTRVGNVDSIILYDKYDGGIPPSVQKWSGMSDILGSHLAIDGKFHSLASYNDGHDKAFAGRRFTFLEIADWIERNYKCL